jgi:hypothetical protein
MKAFSLFLLACALCVSSFAQNGYAINLTLKPYKNEYVYLGYHYGKIKALADSVKLDANSKGVFKGKEKLQGGIYFVVSPSKQILFELLIDKQQNFSISADSAAPDKAVFTNSPDNTLFQSYSQTLNKIGSEMNTLRTNLSKSTSKADSAKIQDEWQKANARMQAYRNDVEAKNPTSFLAALLRAMKEPKVPEASNMPGGKYDSLYAYNYYKSHYWDGVSFSDERLIRTPEQIFEGKLNKYYENLVPPVSDSIIKEVDKMLDASSGNKEMFKYLLTHFIQDYINPKYMGLDAVYVHLFEKYINNNPKVDWFTDKYKKYMSDRAYSLMANLIGLPAQDLLMTDTSGKLQTLYEVKSNYIVLCFWDPTCSHCKEMVPKLDSMYQNKWKKEGVKIFGVMVDGGKAAWLNYIRENNLKDWIHAYETDEQKDEVSNAGKPSYKQLYDVFQTPVLYLLDKDKRIIAKKLTYDQVEEVLQLKLKQQ